MKRRPTIRDTDMHQHFDTIERELRAAIESATDSSALLSRLDRLMNDVAGARFSAGFATFGEQFTQGSEPQAQIEAVEPPARKFRPDDRVRTKDGYLGRVGPYVGANKVLVNVVFQAAEYSEDELRLSPI